MTEHLNPSLNSAATRNAALEPQPLSAEWFVGRAERPNLFSETRLWVEQDDLLRMAQAIQTMDQVLNQPGYQRAFAARFGVSVPVSGRTPGVLYGYDFHLAPTGPKLIEINTNAGGAFLNALLGEAWAQHAEGSTCSPSKTGLVRMFEQDWQYAYPDSQQPTGCLVIVDEDPSSQYLYPEFELCQRWLSEAGWSVRIADPAELTWDGQHLRYGDEAVAMVYNRLTDFYLQTPQTAALRTARQAGAVLMTPAPDAHLRMADKRHLMTLGDAEFLTQAGVPESQQTVILDVVPACTWVQPEHADEIWAQRKQAFFKPVAGFGSRATYRGDKLTKRVFEEILAGDYIMQALVPPSERVVSVEGEMQSMKVDVRNYAYRGEVLGLAARLYQGQTTNFRTPGGGFAPVYSV